jgi:hypothetical protein
MASPVILLFSSGETVAQRHGWTEKPKELSPVYHHSDSRLRFVIDRDALPLFGLTSYGSIFIGPSPYISYLGGWVPLHQSLTCFFPVLNAGYTYPHKGIHAHPYVWVARRSKSKKT